MAPITAGVEVALAASPQARKLRVGLLADAAQQPRWLIDAFAKVAASEFAEIAVLAVASPQDTHATNPTALLRAYAALDRWAFGANSSELADLGREVAHRRFVGQPDAAQLKELDLDVLFVLGGVDERAYGGVARFGVWRFCFGPESADPEALAGWREVAEDTPVTGSGIQVRLASDAPARLAYQSWSRTYPLSVARNRDRLLRKTAEFAFRALRDLHRSGPGWLERCKVLKPSSQAASASGLTQRLPDIAGRIVHRGLQKALYAEQWFLAFRFREARFGDARAIPPDLAGYRRLMPPMDRTWADPFALEKNGRYFVFFEELPFKEGKAHIAMVELKRDGSHSAPVRVLERDYHLSYPFLTEHEGQLLMIPETAQNGTVEVYRCIDFPLRWRKERVLLEGVRCVDATFHRGPDRWWMFANAAAPGLRKAEGAFDDELHLYHAERLLGDWQPHPRNPVKSDARCSRPAGALFQDRGALYRPAQICVPLYGAGLSINRVLRLTPQEYVERQVERILPARQGSLLGLHTVNRSGDLTVVDGFTRRPRVGF